MATKEQATLILKLKDQASKGLQAIRKHALALGASFVAIGAGALKLATLASESREVETAFTNLAESQGQNAREMLSSMKRLSQGTVSDLNLMKQANQALMLGLPVEKFGDMLKVARSAAKATGQSMDFMLQSIVTGLGRQSKLILDNLGIMIDVNKANENYAKTLGKTSAELTEQERKQAFVNEAMRVGIENAEKAGAGTLSFRDKMEQLKASAANAAVSVGKRLVPAMARIADFVAETAAKWQGLSFDTSFIEKSVAVVISSFKNLGTVIGGVMAMASTSISQVMKGNFTAAAESATTIWEQMLDDLRSETEALDEEFNEINAAKAEERVQKQQELSEKINAVKQKEREDDLKNQAAKDKKEVAMAQDVLMKKMGFNQQQVTNTQSTLSEISKLQESSNKAAFFVGKAAALSNAIINTSLAYTRALSATPWPPLNMAMAGAVFAAGMMQVSRISGTNIGLAEGGIVRATPGGTQATIGEGGQDEAVIPLDDDEAREAIGGGNTFVFNGPLMGDQQQARELALAIDKQMLDLRRNNESEAFSGVL